ncbi:MAG: hypothetical protein CME47_08155 [Halieaceae bacterium]|nr:hypothetical protein [Halieaceae bacterium]
MTNVKTKIFPNRNFPLRRPSLQKEDAQISIDRWFSSNPARFEDLRVQNLQAPKSSGVANETWLVETIRRTPINKIEAPGPRLVFRLAADDFLYPRSDLRLHYDLYDCLGSISDLPVPEMLAFEEDPSFLGCRFFVMTHVEGFAAPDRPNFNYDGWLADYSVGDREAVWREAVSVMSRLHAVDVSRLTPLKLDEFSSRGGVRDCLDYWIAYADWCGAAGINLISLATDWLEENLPLTIEQRAGISWGDARLQNLLFDGTRCSAILDWDMVSLAGAEADFAWWTVADHKYTASRGLPRLEGIGSPAETIALWESMSGRELKNFDWHLVFAAFRQALISQRLVALSGTNAAATQIPHEPSIGLQWLSCLLDIRVEFTVTLPFVGLDK